jgi:hypothetical protein
MRSCCLSCCLFCPVLANSSSERLTRQCNAMQSLSCAALMPSMPSSVRWFVGSMDRCVVSLELSNPRNCSVRFGNRWCGSSSPLLSSPRANFNQQSKAKISTRRCRAGQDRSLPSLPLPPSSHLTQPIISDSPSLSSSSSSSPGNLVTPYSCDMNSVPEHFTILI